MDEAMVARVAPAIRRSRRYAYLELGRRLRRLP